MALFPRVPGKMATLPAQRVRLARLALIVVGIALCALLGLAIYVGSNIYAYRECDMVLDFDLLSRRQPDYLGWPESHVSRELRIGIGVASDAGGAPRPEYRVGQRAVRDLTELSAALVGRLGEPGGRGTPVVIEASDDAEHGSVIAVIDCLRRLRFRNVRFRD